MTSSNLPPLDSQRDSTRRRIPTTKQKAFAKKYAETMNATESAMQVYKPKNRLTAQVMGAENLTKPIIRQEIEALMNRNGVKIDDVLSIHKRNMLQSDNLPVSQKAVGDFYDILGVKTAPQDNNSVKVAFIIEQ